MHPGANKSHILYAVYMPNRRQRRRSAKAQRHAQPPVTVAARLAVREASSVERLAYTRTQAAETLGVSRTTFDRRVLPLLETVVMPWGTRLIPADELHRLLAQQRRAAHESSRAPTLGMAPVLPAQLVTRIRADRAAGRRASRESHGSSTRTRYRRRAAAHGGGRRPWPRCFAETQPE